jgi:hypothetical protein
MAAFTKRANPTTQVFEAAGAIEVAKSFNARLPKLAGFSRQQT